MILHHKQISLVLPVDFDELASSHGYVKIVFLGGKVAITQFEDIAPKSEKARELITGNVYPPEYTKRNPTLPLYTGVTLTGIELDCTIAQALKIGLQAPKGVPDWRGFLSYLNSGYAVIETSQGNFHSGNGFIGTSRQYHVARTFGLEKGVVAVMGSGLDVNRIQGPGWTYSREEESTYVSQIPARQIVAFVPPEQVVTNTPDNFTIYVDSNLLLLRSQIHSWVPLQTVYLGKDGSAKITLNNIQYDFDSTTEKLVSGSYSFEFEVANREHDGHYKKVCHIQPHHKVCSGGSILRPELVVFELQQTDPLSSLLSCLPMFGSLDQAQGEADRLRRAYANEFRPTP